jgi:membrane-associated protease RseP (regulator of RpoE activity)
MDPAAPFPAAPPAFVWRPHPKFQDRVWLHALLFVLTFATTTLTGIGHYMAFRSDFLPSPSTLSARLIWTGLYYSVTILAILGCHELGHYFACRYYDVDASLPFFLPVPTPLTGTLGAFIRIREPIPAKRMLFDIGIAGPLAGFAVAVPALLLGMSLSHVTKLPPNFSGFELGEPLLFKLVSWLTWGSIPDGYSLNLHPIAFAAWFGLLATALNLFPVGQLDGGHICYAVFGRRSTYVTIVMVMVAVALSFVSASWIVWTGLMVVMLFVFGPRHPRVFDEEVPLDRTRRWLALAALIILGLCFTPAPISPFDLIAR